MQGYAGAAVHGLRPGGYGVLPVPKLCEYESTYGSVFPNHLVFSHPWEEKGL